MFQDMLKKENMQVCVFVSVCVYAFALVCESSDVPSSASTSLPSGERMSGL